MPLAPSSPLHRYRVDPRAARRDEIARLEALGVVLVEIPPREAHPLLTRFVNEFVEPASCAQLLSELAGTSVAERSFDFERWLRPECVQPNVAPGCLRWLASGTEAASCLRFERCAHLPALSIALATFDDAWAASWPGVFVSFETGRAVVVTLDYEEVRCDVRAASGTPYR